MQGKLQFPAAWVSYAFSFRYIYTGSYFELKFNNFNFCTADWIVTFVYTVKYFSAICLHFWLCFNCLLAILIKNFNCLFTLLDTFNICNVICKQFDYFIVGRFCLHINFFQLFVYKFKKVYTKYFCHIYISCLFVIFFWTIFWIEMVIVDLWDLCRWNCSLCITRSCPSFAAESTMSREKKVFG